jgi:hypothetical protein
MIFDNVHYDNPNGILNCDSKIAIVLFGDNINSELITQALECCKEKFKSHNNVTYFYEITNTGVWENLYQVAFKKRKFEIGTKKEFHYVIAINVRNINVINNLNFDNIKCSGLDLHYFSGFFNKSSWKTSIYDAGFYCISRIFDLASNFINVKEKIEKLACDDKSFGDNSPDHAFYYYLKTLNLKTYCATTIVPGTYIFKEIIK